MSDTPTPAEIAAKALHDMPSPIAETEFEPGYWRSCVTWAQLIEKAAPAVIAALSEHYHLLPKAEHNDSFEGNDDEHGWRSWSLPGGGINVFDDGAISMEIRYAYGVDPTGVRVIASALASAADVAEVKP
ncbi:hypothetical protein [Gordonia amicalis]|uniref:hypothetical protein n=1 Tax=Gordonia amicalis TaxID=89053 RepID=UPI0024BB19F8|nr:hypothetical protein [Gordonia amicalis]MDJ0454390.1 hypothetical protein [Gordonia amicalis]MDV7077721.1 hypothetical protein [Gordonia amicalis]